MKTICAFCHASCGMIVKVNGGIISEVRGDPEHPTNKGILCPKGQAAIEFVHCRDRLLHPQLKTRGGFRRVSWQEALDIAADRLGKLREKYGPGSLLRFAGAPMDYEGRDAFIQLMASYGSPNFTGAGNLCSIPRIVGMKSVFGNAPEPDYKHAKLIIFWGANPRGSARYGHYSIEEEFGDFRSLILEARKRGIRVITVDPVYSETARASDSWVSLEPGTDAALALSMIHVIIKERIYDEQFVKDWTAGFEALQAHVEDSTPEWGERMTGVSASTIEGLAREYALTGPATIRDGNGLDMHTNGVQAVRAIMFLIALTGNYDRPGGNVIFPWVRQSVLPTPESMSQVQEKRISQKQFPLFPDIPSPALLDDLLSGGSPRAMIVPHSNPVLVLANTRKVKEAFGKLDFLIVFEVFPTATAQMADLILPSTTFLERYGYRAYSNRGGGFLSLRQKVIEPVGETRSFPEVEYEIAKRLGLGEGYPFKNNVEWVEYMLKPSGFTIDDLREKAFVVATPPMTYRKYLETGFPTSSKKVEFYSDSFKKHNFDPLPRYIEPLSLKDWVDSKKEKFPFKGTTRKPYEYIQTNFRNLTSLKELYPAPVAMLHPGDADSRGIKEGDSLRFESPDGSIKAEAKITDGVRRGMVVVDFGWGNPWDKWEGVNALTSGDVWDPISGGTPNRLFVCNISSMGKG
jgi:anaerobic selenocysteine-containing dehydrogenase